MQPTTRTNKDGLVAVVALAILLAGILPLAPARAASGPTLSYTVTPSAYNNTVQVGPNGMMAHPKVVTGPDPANVSLEDVYVIGANASVASGCVNGNALIVLRSTDGGANFTVQSTTTTCVAGTELDAVVLANGTLVVAAPGPYVLVSTDGGATFQTTATLGVTSSYASLSLDSSTGDLYIAFPTVGIIEVSVSANGGASWSTPVPTLAPAVSSEIAVRAGVVVLAYPELVGSLQIPAVVVSSDGGLTFSAEILLTAATNLFRTSVPSVAVSAAGVFAVAWSQETDAYVNETMTVVSQDGGATWSSAVVVNTATNLVAPPPSGVAAFDSEGRLFVASHNYSANFSTAFLTVASSNTSLDTFTNASFAIRFQASGSNATQSENLAADASGRVFLAWAVNNGATTPSPGYGVFVRTVTGAASGSIQGAANATASMTITLTSTTSGRVASTVTWTGQAVLVVELPPDDYQVAVSNGSGGSPKPAGTMPVRAWGRTSFTVDVSGVVSPPPGQPFPWLLAGGVGMAVALLGAALVSVHYTRLRRESILQRKVRLLLFEYLSEHPGTGYAAVRDALGLQNGVASYHLSVLEKQGLLHSETKGRRRFYYVSGNPHLWRDLPLSDLQSSILATVRTTPGIGVRELGRAIGREPSSVGYNVKALAREGLLRTDRDGLRVRCYPEATETAVA